MGLNRGDAAFNASKQSEQKLTSNEECHKVVQHELFVVFHHAFWKEEKKICLKAQTTCDAMKAF